MDCGDDGAVRVHHRKVTIAFQMAAAFGTSPGVGVSHSRISQLAAEVRENGENGKMGGNGGIWGIVGNCQKHIVGSVEKMCEIGGKREENWRKVGQFGTKFPFVPVTFSPLFHNLTTSPSSSFDEFRQPNQPTGKMGISGLADIGRSFGQRRRLQVPPDGVWCMAAPCATYTVLAMSGLWVLMCSSRGVT